MQDLNCVGCVDEINCIDSADLKTLCVSRGYKAYTSKNNCLNCSNNKNGICDVFDKTTWCPAKMWGRFNCDKHIPKE